MEIIAKYFPVLVKGGWLMLPILFLSIIALGIILERFWVLVIRRSRIFPKNLLPQIRKQLKDGKIEQAISTCEKDSSVMSRILLEGLGANGAPREILREVFEDAGRREGRMLERYLGALGAIAGVSPLLGLLGTVIGMIEIFDKISDMKLGQYSAMASGINIALYTTAFGLTVAIPSYLAFKAYGGIVESLLRDMEEEACHMLNLLGKENQDDAKTESA